MFQGRYTMTQSSGVRKSRVESKPSMLPKPTRTGSIDRASMEARRPSNATRSSSADHVRCNLAAGGRLSREASATKLSLNRRSRSQQADSRYGHGQTSMTPLRGSQYASRPTTTPVRTPSEDRMNRSWQASVERALAFVTMKDQRAVSTVQWQRAEFSRVQEALAARLRADGGMQLMRPLTIARFVDIVGTLMADIAWDIKLNNDNYVAKLPHLAKKLLYPGTVSKSWLKTVNTLHAFPHALAFIGYFLDLVDHIERPMADEWLYKEKDEIASLRHDYIYKCWIRFQDPGHDFEDLNEEYLEQLKHLLGDDEHKIAQLHEVIKQMEMTLEDSEDACAAATERLVRERRDGLAATLRSVRGERAHARTETQRCEAARHEHAHAARAVEHDIAALTADIQELKRELDTQAMSVSERARLLDEVDYAARVGDCKRTLADQLNKMILSKEAELALMQQRTLDSCVEYKQRLIHLAAHLPDIHALAVDEKELMSASCASQVCGAVEALRAHAQQLAERRAATNRERNQLARQRTKELEETRAQISDLKALIDREQAALDAEGSAEAGEAARWAADCQQLAARVDQLRASEEQYHKAQADMEFWEQQDHAWRAKLSEMHAYNASLSQQLARSLETEKRKRGELTREMVTAWHRRLDHLDREEARLEDEDRQRRERAGDQPV